MSEYIFAIVTGATNNPVTCIVCKQIIAEVVYVLDFMNFQY